MSLPMSSKRLGLSKCMSILNYLHNGVALIQWPVRGSRKYVNSSETSGSSHQSEESASSYEGLNHIDGVRRIIRSFLLQIGTGDDWFMPPDTNSLQALVIAELNALEINDRSAARWVPWACQVTEGFYPQHPSELKVLITICNIAIFHVDDVLAGEPGILCSFQNNLHLGVPQPDPILECLSKVLIPRMWNYYDPVAANAIATGIQEFINGTAFEIITKEMDHQPSAPQFPEYVRLKSGAPAAYAYWLFYSPERSDVRPFVQSIPDLMALINRVNDILSFYKEELAGEDDNFVHMRAKLSGNTILESLQEICDESLGLVTSISNTLETSPNHLQIFTQWFSRYVHFHTSTTRYRLKELLET